MRFKNEYTIEEMSQLVASGNTPVDFSRPAAVLCVVRNGRAIFVTSGDPEYDAHASRFEKPAFRIAG